LQCWATRDDIGTERSWQLRRVSGSTQLRINGSDNVLSTFNSAAFTQASDNETTLGFIRDSGTWYLYGNGQEVDSSVGAALDAAAVGLSIARYDGSSYYCINGQISDVVVLTGGAVKEDLSDLHDLWTGAAV
jgi:hypothetical protein